MIRILIHWYPAAWKANVLIEYENLISGNNKIFFKWSGDSYDPNCAGNIYVSQDKTNWTKIVENQSAQNISNYPVNIPFKYLRTEFPSPDYVSSTYGYGRCGWVGLSEIKVSQNSGLGILSVKNQLASVSNAASQIIEEIKKMIKR